MRNRTAIILTLTMVAMLAAASLAEAGVYVRYSSSNWRVGARLGSYRYGCYPAYRHVYSYGYPTTYAYPSYAVYRHRRAVPLRRLGRLPYIPMGTVYTLDNDAYPYGYPYAYTTLPVVTTSTATASRGAASATYSTGTASTVQRQAPTRVTVNVNLQGAAGREAVDVDTRRPAPQKQAEPSEPAERSWRDGQWRVPTEPQAENSDSSAATDRHPQRPGVESQAGYLRALVRGDDASRLQAATELKRFDTPSTVDALVDALKKDGYTAVRRAAAESLGRMLAYPARKPLWEAARGDRDAEVRRTARSSALKIDAFYDVE